MEIIIGNICSACALITDAISTTRKKPSEVLWIQVITQVFYLICNYILKGYPIVVQNIAAIARNIVAAKKMNNKYIEWFLTIAPVVIGIMVNNHGLIGYLPIVGNLAYSLAIFKNKDDEKKIKIFFAVAVTMCAIFNLAIYNYVGTLASIFLVCSVIAYFVKDKRQSKKSENE